MARKSATTPLEASAEREEESIEVYLRSARSWNTEKSTERDKSENRAWNVAKAAGIFALLSIVAVILLLPLKQTKTVVLVADKSTGNIEQMTTLEEARVSLGESFIKNFITKFMRAREGYNPTMNEDNYYEAAAFLAPQLQNEWNELWKPENQNNLMKRYGSDKIKRVDISSIVINPSDDGNKKTVTVRYSTSIIQSGFAQQPEFNIANMSFGYTEVSKSERERRINPAGFQIISYQTDPEIGGKPEIRAAQ